MGQMVDHQSLADQMNALMDYMETLDKSSDEFAQAAKNMQVLYSIAKGEVELGLSATQAKQKNETDIRIQELKNDAEKDKNSKLLAGTIIGASVSAAMNYYIAQKCRHDEDEGKPWLSKATQFLQKPKGR